MSASVCFYGDDVTGSSDALGQFARCGLSTLLLFRPPEAAELTKLAGGVDVVGVAGSTRASTKADLTAEVTAAFELFKQLGPAIVQYKVCSTFDSSPERGSIGAAAEAGQRVFGSHAIPVVAAQPDFGRYTVFGNHFVRASDGLDDVVRLDRHPGLANHPVTPMHEADLRRHLAQQTSLPVHSFSLLALHDGQRIWSGGAPELVVFDAMTNDDLRAIGRLIWRTASAGTRLAIGSGGLSLGLGSALAEGRSSGALPPGALAGTAPEEPVMLAACGSCAPVTFRQIDRARLEGWLVLQLGRAELHDDRLFGKIVEQIRRSLVAGVSVVVATATGPADVDERQPPDEARIGQRLSSVVSEATAAGGVRRVLIAGGDSAGQVLSRLPVTAGRLAAQLDPMVSLLRLDSDRPALDGVTLVLKGGQVGGDDLFERVRRGRIDRALGRT